MTSAVRYGPAAPLGTPLADLSGGDDRTQTIASAFPINFFGAVSDHLCVTTNGGLYPVSGDTGCSNDYDESVADLAISSEAPMIAALAGDLDLGEDDDIVDDGFGTAGEIYAATTTIDGADAMTLTWYRVPMYDDENDRTLSNTFQIALIKGATGDDTVGWDFTIEYNYGTLTDGEDGYDVDDPSSGCSSGEDVCRWGIGWASHHAAIDIAAISVTGGVATITTAAAHGLTGTGSSIRLELPDDDGSAALDGERVTATRTGATTLTFPTSADDHTAAFELGSYPTFDAGEGYELFGDTPVAELLDSGRTAMTGNRLNSSVTGRYVFGMTGGATVGFDVPELTVTDGSSPSPAPAPAPASSPVADPEGGLPVVTPPGSTSGSVGGAPSAPTPSVPTSGTAQFEVGVVRTEIRTGGAGTVAGSADAPVVEVVRDRVGTVGGGGMTPGGIVQVWMPLPGGGSRQVALLPVAPDGTFDGALPFTGELDGRGPLPIGERTIQLYGTDANGQLTVINVGIRVQQPGPLAPEPERTPGAPPSLAPGQSLATNAGIPTPVTVTPQPGSRRVGVTGEGWLLEIDVPEGTVRDEAGNPIMEIVTGDDTEVRGTGFMPGTRAYVWIMSTPTFLGEVTVRSDGSFAGDLPVDVAPGQHTLQVAGVGTDGYVRAANLGVTVLAGDGSPRPNRVAAGEGTAPLLPFEIGVLALALAAGLAAADRTRRRSRSTAP